MKMDKEYLAKHHFWFLLAAYAPMVFLGLILLWTSVAGAIDGEAKAISAVKDSVKKYAAKDVKNEEWIRAFKIKADKLAKKKNDVWNEVWLGQSAIFTWPAPLAELNSYDYGEDIRDPQKRDTYINDKDCYGKQVNDLVAIVQPVNDKGEGVVQFNGGWKDVLTYVPRWLGRERLTLPSSEEIWLAQEDLWVQRELLRVIRDTNDGLALYEKSKTPPARRKDEVDRQVFENLRWRLELGLTRDEIRWKVTNRSPRLQTLALTFRLTFKPRSPKPLDLWVDGEPLAPNQSSKEVSVKLPGALPPSAIEGVEQALDWRTAPVKRIDRLKLAYVSSSTSGKPLTPYPRFAPRDDGSSPPTGGAPTTAMPTGPAGPTGFPGMERPGGAKGGNDMGLEKNRYLETSDQVRRMPVAMVLIVDQSHVQDVLTAFARSRLRFQTTQVEWKRYRGSIQPVILEDKGAGEAEVGAGGKRPRRPVMAPPGAMRPPATVRPNQTNPAAADQAEDDEDSSNLVELGLYGITSLYAKYPPKPAADAAASNGPAPVAPIPGPAPVAPAPNTPAAPTTPPATAPAPVPSKQ